MLLIFFRDHGRFPRRLAEIDPATVHMIAQQIAVARPACDTLNLSARTVERHRAEEPTQRDQHIQSIAERGRLGWRRQAEYGKRSKAETAMARYKRILGGQLRTRTLPGQQAEAAIGVAVLNRMIDQARPNSVRAA
ncbi:hypothetical protein D3877_25500 [Azospirillum cavernae]|uniref:Transposase n=2 Tax=Azospirillum cavernae TaxID=2320860 RepID=A0A418VQA2_9PROT|nr:hypothetical protein D3877_25500 [Azospirillum cavernae]